MRRFGTLFLAVLAGCDFSIHAVGIGAQVPVTFRTKAWLSFAPPPCRMPLGPSQASPKLIPMATPRFCDSLIRFRHVISGLLALASLERLPDGISSRRFRNAAGVGSGEFSALPSLSQIRT